MSEQTIPKVIHYCWFGGAPLPESARRCMQSWKTFCPDYEIIRWDESNFDFHANRYAQEAYERGKWAFVSDYARLKIVYDHGGIYLDTDVELVKPLDPLLEQEGFLGFQDASTVATGLGFGAAAHHPVIEAMLKDYEGISFLRPDGTMDLTACPERNTRCLEGFGLRRDGSFQMAGGIAVYPAEFFSPMDWHTGRITVTEHTYSIHRFDASWLTPFGRFKSKMWKLLNRHPRVYRFARRVKHLIQR